MFELWTGVNSNPRHAPWDLRETDLCKKCLRFLKAALPKEKL